MHSFGFKHSQSDKYTCFFTIRNEKELLHTDLTLKDNFLENMKSSFIFVLYSFGFKSPGPFGLRFFLFD